MTKDTFWIVAFCLPIVAVLTESLLPEHITYVTDAMSQNAFVIKTWTYRGSALVVTVTKGNKTLFSDFIYGVSVKEQENRLFIKYNNSREEVSLILNNVTRDDEGLYQISSTIAQIEAKGLDRISETWNVQLNVLEPSEIKQGSAGENILITEFLQESIFCPRLYHNDQLIAVLRGSDCGVSTNSPFYGRIRCSKDTDNKTMRIEINHVTENDTGLYTVEAEGSLTQQCFLNITERFDENNSDQTRNITLPATVRSRTTVNRAHSSEYILCTFTNIVSALTIVTPPDRFEGNNSDQPSNKTLSTTAISSTAVNRASSKSELFYILTITTVAFAIILFFSSLIWIQRRNIKSFKAVQRIVLETMETASSAAFSTLRRCSHTPSRVEIGTSDSNYLRDTVTNPAGRLQYPTPKVSTSGHNTCHKMTQQLDDDYYTFDVTDTILKICESHSRSNKTLLAECQECPGSLIDVYRFPADEFSASIPEEHFDREISNANGQCQVTRNTEDTYAKVKKLSSINNLKAGDSCKDGYEMVDFSHFDNPTNGVQDVELALRREPQTQRLWSYHEEKAFSARKEEQGEEIALSGSKEEQ